MLCFILLATTTKFDIAESNWNDQSAQNVLSKTIVIGEATQNTPSDSNKTVTIESADATQAIHYDMTQMVNSTPTTLYDTTEVDYESERTFYDKREMFNATQTTQYDTNDTVNATVARYDTTESVNVTQVTLYENSEIVNTTQVTLYDTNDTGNTTQAPLYDSNGTVNATHETLYDTNDTVNNTQVTYIFNATTATLKAYLETVNATGKLYGSSEINATQATLYDTNEIGNTTQETYLVNATTATLNAFLETINATGSGNGDMYFVYLPFGVISIAGNIMIIIIMSTSDNRGKLTSLLFIILAISDTSLTINNMFYSYVQAANVAGFTETEERSLIFGIITNLIWRINVHFSNYVLVVITLERVIGIAIPFHVKTICRRKYLLASITIILIVLAVANIPLWIIDWPSGNMENLELLDLVLGFFLPFLAILVGGLYIFVKVKYGRLLSSSPYNFSVTNIVIGANVAFLVTMLPRRIVYLIETGSADEDKENFLIIIFQGLESLNTGVNFFVYILAGRKFRDDFVNFVLRRTKKSSSQSISKNSNNSDTN